MYFKNVAKGLFEIEIETVFFLWKCLIFGKDVRIVFYLGKIIL